jgi:uncharacterized membrane protein
MKIKDNVLYYQLVFIILYRLCEELREDVTSLPVYMPLFTLNCSLKVFILWQCPSSPKTTRFAHFKQCSTL